MVAVRPIAFARHKYGVPLSIDAGPLAAMPDFIQHDEPHAPAFHELLFVHHGRGTLEVDDRTLEVGPNTTFVTRPGQVRRWQLRERLDATVVLFERELVDGFAADPAFLDDVLGDAVAIELAADDRAYGGVVASRLSAELRALRPHAEHALRAGLYQLLVCIRRGQAAASLPAATASLARRFAQLVERHHRRYARVADYAQLLGVTPAYLTRVAVRDLGAPASDVIHARIVLAAKRALRYSDQPIAAVAAELGFSDPSYFVRFFRRIVGVTPRRFRMSHSRS